MRGIEVVFMKGKEELKATVPWDDSTANTAQYLPLCEKVAPINISPKAVVKLNLHGHLGELGRQLDFNQDFDKVYLRYIDEKNRKRKLLLHTIKLQQFK
jgi:hypothetical protein